MSRRKDERMIIVSKDRTSLSNMEYVASIYIAGDWSIKANMNGNVSMIKLGTYTSEKAAEYAFQILLNAIASGKGICYMPQDSEVQAEKALDERKYRHIDGRKTKGHGGS